MPRTMSDQEAIKLVGELLDQGYTVSFHARGVLLERGEGPGEVHSGLTTWRRSVKQRRVAK